MEMLAVHLGERKDSLMREAIALAATTAIATSKAQHCPPAGLSARGKQGVDNVIGLPRDSAGCNASVDDDFALGSLGVGSIGLGSERGSGSSYISMWAAVGNSARQSLDGSSRHSLDCNNLRSPNAPQWPNSPFQQCQPANVFMRSSSIPAAGNLATSPKFTLPGRVSTGQLSSNSGNFSIMSLWPDATEAMELSCPHQVALKRTM